MNKCVSIFGGIGTKEKHYKYAIDVYKKNNYKVFFYENSKLNFAIPALSIKTCDKAIKNDPNGHIIHINSGGFWTGLQYYNKSKHNKLFICEASPIERCSKTLIKAYEKIIKYKLPIFFYNNSDYICKILGIPTKINNAEWASNCDKDTSNIKNFVCLTSKNDEIINPEYIDEMIKKINQNGNTAIRHEFDTGNHWNISKSDVKKYQDILQKNIDKIDK